MKHGLLIYGAVMTMLPCVAMATGEPSPSTITSVGYVNATRQAMIPAGTGDRVVTYGDANGAIGTRTVHDDLSDVTTSDTGFATAGAIQGEVNTKNDPVLNLSNRNVVTYSGSEGIVTSTPIYDGSINTFSNGLVDASTLNSAMIAAANSELTQVNENGQADSNGTLWVINNAPTVLNTTMYLPANVPATGYGPLYCYKSHASGYNAKGNCADEIYNAMQNGEWAAVFSYGTVTGISVCSNIEPSVKYDDGSYPYQVSTNQSGLQTAYDAWVSDGRPSTVAGGYCYCKLANPSGSAARWVFVHPLTTPRCATGCAHYCPDYVQYYSNFRAVVFGAAATN